MVATSCFLCILIIVAIMRVIVWKSCIFADDRECPSSNN